MIIGLFGFIGSGKTSAANILEDSGFVPLSFASSLKDATSAIFGWDRDMLEGDTIESRKFREQVDPYWSEKFGKPVTPRWMLQHFGTNICRNHLLESIWLSSLERKISQYENVVVTDVRFLNEIEFLRSIDAKFLQIDRTSAEPSWIKLYKRWDLETFEDFAKLNGIHESEYDWLTSPVKRCIIDNNGDLDHLKRQLTEWVAT